MNRFPGLKLLFLLLSINNGLLECFAADPFQVSVSLSFERAAQTFLNHSPNDGEIQFYESSQFEASPIKITIFDGKNTTLADIKFADGFRLFGSSTAQGPRDDYGSIAKVIVKPHSEGGSTLAITFDGLQTTVSFDEGFFEPKKYIARAIASSSGAIAQEYQLLREQLTMHSGPMFMENMKTWLMPLVHQHLEFMLGRAVSAEPGDFKIVNSNSGSSVVKMTIDPKNMIVERTGLVLVFSMSGTFVDVDAHQGMQIDPPASKKRSRTEISIEEADVTYRSDTGYSKEPKLN